jgi:2-dehydro-3-deoxyphosphogalactonate aldolase
MNGAASWPVMRRDLVAILRGLRPEEAHDTVKALIDEGFEAIEIPLNSPEPFRSVEIAAKAAAGTCLIGAGTILTAEDADRVHDAGGRLFVSPNVDAAVISRAAGLGMVVMPGVFTPTEALAALKAGASGLKFFPASVLGPSGISAIRTILPPATVIAAVGGVGEGNFGDYLKAGIKAFGLGSSLYRPGQKAAETRDKARATVAAFDRAVSGI